jgi:hypothetical protein
VGGYHYRLYNRDGDEVGQLESLIPNWQVGETYMTGDGRRFRISIVGLDESDDSSGRWQAAFMVEAASEA